MQRGHDRGLFPRALRGRVRRAVRGGDARWIHGLPPRGEPEPAWVQHVLWHLRPGGEAAVLMPPAAAHRRSGRRVRAAERPRRRACRVIALRTERADVLFKAGDCAAAASAFHALIEDAVHRDGAGSETALALRLNEADSRALNGAVDRALAQLGDLIGDQARLFGKDDARVLDLRRRQALLMHGAGRTATAVRVLEDLADDLEHLHGPDGQMLHTVQQTLTRIGLPLGPGTPP